MRMSDEAKRLEARNIWDRNPGEVHVHACRKCTRVISCTSKFCNIDRNQGVARTCLQCMSPEELLEMLDDGAFEEKP
jgi:hypothetical protein